MSRGCHRAFAILTTGPLQIDLQWSTEDRSQPRRELDCAGLRQGSVSPRPCPFKEKPRSGPLVAKVFPCLSDSSQGWISRGRI